MNYQIMVYDKNGKDFILGSENENGFTGKNFSRQAAVLAVQVLRAMGFTAEVLQNGVTLKVVS